MHEHSSSRRRRLSVGTSTAALSLGLCLCAGQLLAPTAASAATTATPVVAAAQATAKVTPSVSFASTTRTVKWGSKVKVTVRVYNPSTGKPVTSGYVRLEGSRGGKYTAWTSAKVNSNGAVALYAKPLATINFRAVYLGNSAYNVRYTSAYRYKVVASGAKILAEAKAHKGALYKFAASGPKRFDCSGFTKYVYKKAAGKSLPHKANTQQKYGKAVAKKNIQVGDLIIFRSGSYGYHAAIYAGGGYMYDSPHTGARVGKHKIYGKNYVVRRLVA